MNEQIEEMRKEVASIHRFFMEDDDYEDLDDYIADELYNAGYHKQREARWVDNHCTACGMTPIGEETWTKQGQTPPKFEYFMSFCPCCGAKMKGGAEQCFAKIVNFIKAVICGIGAPLRMLNIIENTTKSLALLSMMITFSQNIVSR